jgi:hypothetical protein
MTAPFVTLGITGAYILDAGRFFGVCSIFGILLVRQANQPPSNQGH